MNDDMLTPPSLSFEPSRRDRITAISSAIQRRPIILVVGMHRSGTSLCSHLLSALGVDMADNIPGPGATSPVPSNPRGHWERWEIVEFHDRILGLFNRGYSGGFHDFALPVAWWADPRVVEIRREILAFLEKRMGNVYFGFKDPRTVRLMPVWHQIFKELKLAPKVVLCLRNPAQIARSLNARDGLDPEIGEYRWLVHMIDFFRYSSNLDFCTVEYEEWFNNPLANIEKLQKFLDLQWQQSEADLGLVLSGIIDSSARHDDSDRREASQPLVRTLYKLAGRAGQDGSGDQIAYIVSQFVSFQQLQRPFQQAFEDVAKVAAKFPEVEQEAAGLRAAVGERNAVVEAADAKAAAVEARLAERERALAEVSRRADELLGALQAAQAEAAVREAALAQAERVSQERTVAAEVMQAEVGALREALAQAEREAQDRAVAGEAMQAEFAALREALAQAEREAQDRAVAGEAMQAEVAALWDALAQAEREAQQRETAAVAMQGELAALRGTLAQAEGEVRKRAATTAALQAEIATLRGRLAQAEGEAPARAALQAEIAAVQGALAAARQVGKAATAAFRVETVAPTKPDGPFGWRQAVTRFFGAGTSF